MKTLRQSIEEIVFNTPEDGNWDQDKMTDQLLTLFKEIIPPKKKQYVGDKRAMGWNACVKTMRARLEQMEEKE